MVVILCRSTKQAYYFPDAIDFVDSQRCPARDCQAKVGGICVIGKKDGDLTCMASFDRAPVAMGCGCSEAPCEHCGEDHATFLPVLQMWADMVEPYEARTIRLKQEQRARLLEAV